MFIDGISSLCLFSLICFGDYRLNPINGSQCHQYNYLHDTISLNCESQSTIGQYKDLKIHALAINGTPHDEQATLVDIEFNHLIIQNAKFDYTLRQPSSNNNTIAHQSLTIVRSSNIAVWSWANFNFKHIYFEDCLLNPIDDKTSYKVITSEFLPATLQSLSMVNCRIVSIGIGAFSFLSNIRMITITHNHLTTFSRLILPSEAFDLWSIDLSHNKIETLSDYFTKDLPSLRELNLKNNQLLTLPVDLFNYPVNLVEIELSDNPLKCETLCWTFMDSSLSHPKLLDQTQCFLSNQESVILAWSNSSQVGCTNKTSCTY